MAESWRRQEAAPVCSGAGAVTRDALSPTCYKTGVKFLPLCFETRGRRDCRGERGREGKRARGPGGQGGWRWGGGGWGVGEFKDSGTEGLHGCNEQGRSVHHVLNVRKA